MSVNADYCRDDITNACTVHYGIVSTIKNDIICSRIVYKYHLFLIPKPLLFLPKTCAMDRKVLYMWSHHASLDLNLNLNSISKCFQNDSSPLHRKEVLNRKIMKTILDCHEIYVKYLFIFNSIMEK